jgi:hypothetical protein
MPELITFFGPVRIERAPAPLGLTLHGRADAAAGGAASTLAFTASAPADLPARLEGAVVTRLEDGQYRIGSGAREWRLAAAAVHLTREVAPEFYRALPPRKVPLLKRLVWRTVLALAAGRAGPWLLRALRR